MAKDTHGPEDNIGALFTYVGLVPTAEATTDEALASIPERAVHLSEALNYYDTAALLEGDIQMYKDPSWLKAQERRFGKNVSYKIRRQKYEKHQAALDNARSEFDAAYGLSRMLDDPTQTEEEVRAAADKQYDEFQSMFRGSSPARHEKRQAMQSFYAAQILGEAVVAQEASLVERPEFAAPDPTNKISLARALRPEFMQLSAADYQSITTEDMWAVRPEALRAALVDVRPSVANALRYTQDKTSTQRYEYTVFSPAEWGLMLRTDPVFPAQAAFNRSETTQHAKNVDEADPDAPRRAKIHLHERLEDSMRGYVESVIDPGLDLISRFKEASRYNAGLARFGNEANMHDQMEYLWDTIVGDMLWAVRVSHGGSREQEEANRRALEKAVYFAETPARRLRNFGMVIDTAEAWLIAKKNYLQAKSLEAAHYIATHQTSEERQASSQKNVRQSA